MNETRFMHGLLFGLIALGGTTVIGQQLDDLRGVPPKDLISRWENEGPVVRRGIEEVLIDERTESLQALRGALSGGNSEIKRFASAMLARMRDREAVRDIIALTHDPDEKVRTRAVTALRILDAKQAAPRIRELLRTTQDGPVLKVSLPAIGTLGSADDIELVRPLLSHPDKHVQVLAGGTLGMLGSNEAEGLLVRATADPDPLISKTAVQALGFLNSSGARTRLQAIVDDPAGRWKSYAVIGIARQDLASLDVPAQIVKLGELARTRDERVAEWALERLVDMDSPQAMELLQELAKAEGGAGRMATQIAKATGKE